jgi:TonB family protein
VAQPGRRPGGDRRDFALLTWSGAEPKEEPPEFVYDMQRMALAELPPPPPVEELPEQPEVTINPLLLFAEERADSAVRLPSVPIVPPFVPQAAGSIQFDFALTAMKPAVSASFDARRVFERSEVDELPRAILKKAPRLTEPVVRELKTQSIRFLFVVTPEGAVEQVRVLSSTGDSAVDAVCLEALSSWKFTPAVRKGVKVRCWVEQGFNIRPPRLAP